MSEMPENETETSVDPTPGAPTKTLEKGLFLLGLFDHDHPEWTLRELRERAGLTKATTRRLMKTLEASNWVAYDAEAGNYHLGSAVLMTVQTTAAVQASRGLTSALTCHISTITQWPG